MNPIGYVRSPFKFKNGTPRQPTVCKQARGMITIEKSIFNNPEHSLEGLEEFTHVWVLFVFHMNNNPYTKAKVKPPRLNGRKMGLFSTRSPYRPNNIGLTLAKIECVQGATLTVSGIDILDGTPVLDLKPYIPQYDCPEAIGTTQYGEEQTVDAMEDLGSKQEFDDETESSSHGHSNKNSIAPGLTTVLTTLDDSSEKAGGDHVLLNDNLTATGPDLNIADREDSCPVDTDRGDEAVNVHNEEIHKEGNPTSATTFYSKKCAQSVDTPSNVKLAENGENLGQEANKNIVMPNQSSPTKAVDSFGNENNKFSIQTISKLSSVETLDVKRSMSNTSTTAASWIDRPPVCPLTVRFTQTVEEQLQHFTTTTTDANCRLQYLKSSKEAREAIVNILHEDPRSTYRRKQCQDSLYYFTIDIIHVTCWFDEEEVEVVRVKPACLVDQCKHKFSN